MFLILILFLNSFQYSAHAKNLINCTPGTQDILIDKAKAKFKLTEPEVNTFKCLELLNNVKNKYASILKRISKKRCHTYHSYNIRQNKLYYVPYNQKSKKPFIVSSERTGNCLNCEKYNGSVENFLTRWLVNFTTYLSNNVYRENLEHIFSKDQWLIADEYTKLVMHDIS